MCDCRSIGMDGFTHRNFGMASTARAGHHFGMAGFGGSPNLVKDASELTAAGYVVQAPASGSLLDAFGSANRQYVMIGGGLLALFVLMKTLK